MAVPGAIDHALLRLLGEQAGAGASGVITATRGKLKRLFCVEGGSLVFAASNMIEEQFGPELVQQGALSQEALDAAAAAAKSESKKLTRYLHARQQPSAEALRSAMELHARTLLASCHQWKDGEFTMTKGRPSLDGELVVELSGCRLLMDMIAATKVPARTVWNKIGGSVWLRREPRARVGEPTPLESRLLDRTAEACRVEELQACSSEDSEQTLKTIYGLILLGAIVAGDAEVAGAASRKQCEQRLARAESENHYQILGVDDSASESEVREAYYEIARLFHPDRFRTGDLTDLLPRMEAYFSQATQAYNVLSHSELRRAYDHEISDKAGKKEEPLKDQRYLARQNFARGIALAEKRRFQDALRFLRNAVQLDDSEPKYHLEIGRVLALNPRHRAEAEQSLKRALEINPTLVPAIFALGELYLKQDRLDEARARFNDVVGWDPTHVEAQAALSRLGQPAGKRVGR